MEVLPPSPSYGSGATDDVGAFTQGSAASRWALGRYLLGRALAIQVSRALLVIAAVILGVAVAAYFGHLLVLTVFIGLIAVAVLAARALLGAILRRVTLGAQDPETERRLARLVADTRKDVAKELRRIGLPSRSLTMPLLGLRLAGRRRGEVLARLRAFDVERVVPSGRLDELHLLLDAQTRRGGFAG
jgi:hypothetical protein